MAKVFENSMVAHIWANQSQQSGRSHNGQFYFEGERLYSYGAHYLVGWIIKGVALLNDASNSVTTSKHKSYARRAVRGEYIHVPDLTDFARDLPAHYPECPKERKAMTRRALVAQMRGMTLEREQWAYSGMGAPYVRLARLFGFTDKQAEAMAQEARKANDKAKREAEAQAMARNARNAEVWADHTDSEFRQRINSELSSLWNAERNILRVCLELHRLHRDTKGRISASRTKRLAELLKRARAAKANWQALNRRAETRRACRTAIATLRRYNGQLAPVDMTARENADIFGALTTLIASGYLPSVCRAQAGLNQRAAEGRLQAIRTAEARERFEREAQARADWLAGHSGGYTRFSDEQGGALCRIMGDELQTSWGARVPLDHAIRVFRLVAQCRTAGKAWQASAAAPVRVGHFHVDSISANGDFVAGCHRFYWPEVERIARIAGVIEESAHA